MAKKRKILSPAKIGKISIKAARAAVKQVMELGRFRVHYSGKIRPMLDNAITKMAKKQGYEFYASGYNFKTDIRDMAFENGS